MVWAAFWGDGYSEIYAFSRDFTSKKHGYSAWSYIECLSDDLVRFYEPGMIFMQDNAPIHNAKASKAWFERHGIQVLLDWPPYSPDLNPIEHLWWHLKNRLLLNHPELLYATGNPDDIREAIADALRQEWPQVKKEIRDHCIDSMPKRMQAVIDANGYHTKY
jgi:transposase